MSKCTVRQFATPVRVASGEHRATTTSKQTKRETKFDADNGSREGHGRPRSRASAITLAGVGWEFVHVAMDDHSRIAFSRILQGRTASLRRRVPERCGAWACGLSEYS